MIRTFIAVEIDEATRKDLADEVAYLRHQAPKVRWVEPEAYHLTLKFLGGVAEPELPEIFEAMELAAAEAEPFSLEITGLGVFPNLHAPRTVWAGCGLGADALSTLAQTVESHLDAVGYPPERRPYHPHLTLGRVKQPRDGAGLADALADAARTQFGLVDVDEVVIFMSERRKSGPRYTPMQRIALAG